MSVVMLREQATVCGSRQRAMLSGLYGMEALGSERLMLPCARGVGLMHRGDER